MEASVLFMAFAFGIHIALVNLGIAFSTLVPYLKWRGEKSGDPGLVEVSRELMRFYAATYALGGVFGTAFTVFLLSFYPGFIGFAGHLLLVPFGLSAVFIIIHFFSIVAYWYGWGRFEARLHNLIGIVLALSAYLIPLGFRATFAFLNTPQGLRFAEADGYRAYLDLAEALGNPTFLPLYLKSLVGALTAGLLAVSGSYAYRALRKGQMEEAWRRLIENTLPWAMFGLAAMAALGFWYVVSLSGVEYKFNNIFGGLGWRVGSGAIYHDYSWLFLLKMALVAIQVLVIIYVFHEKTTGASGLSGRSLKLLVLAGGAGLLTIVAGEYLNAFSQYPYFVADITDPAVLSSVPEPLRPMLASILDLTRTNPLASGRGLVVLTLGVMGALLVAAGFFLYILLYGKERVDR